MGRCAASKPCPCRQREVGGCCPVGAGIPIGRPRRCFQEGPLDQDDDLMTEPHDGEGFGVRADLLRGERLEASSVNGGTAARLRT